MAKRWDSYADTDSDIMSGNTGGPVGLTSTAPKFTIFSSIYSHMPPPTKGTDHSSGGFTIGDDDDDDDEDCGIDVTSFTEKVATFGSVARRYSKQRDSESVGFADLDESSDSDLVFDLSRQSLKVSMDDININTSSSNNADQGMRHFSMPEKEMSPIKPSGGGGLKRASTMPGSLADMVAAEETQTPQFDFAARVSPPKEAPPGARKSSSEITSTASTSDSEPTLSRAMTVPAKLGELKSAPKEENKTVVVAAPVPKSGSSTSKEVARPKGSILANFFGRQQATIAEENQDNLKMDQTDAPGKGGPLSEQAQQFTAKSSWGGFGGFSQQKSRVRGRDINMWAPGGT